MSFEAKLELLYRGIEALYQIQTGIRVDELLLPARDDTAREALYFRESDDGALEVGLAFDAATKRHFGQTPLEDAFGEASLGHSLPVLEGLSHLAYLAEAARRERPVSGLELETQAEVDKLAFCILHHWPPSVEAFEGWVQRLYYRFELTAFGHAHRERYETANRVAARFSRQLRPHVEARRLPALRSTLRQFWSSGMADKLALAG